MISKENKEFLTVYQEKCSSKYLICYLAKPDLDLLILYLK